MKLSPWLRRNLPVDPAYAGIWCVAAVIVLSLAGCLLSACGGADHRTTVSGGSVQLGDKYTSSSDGDDDSESLEFHMAPASQPAVSIAGPAASQPAPAVPLVVDGRTFWAPPGVSFDYRHVRTKANPAVTTLERHAAATGPSLSTDKDAGNFDGKPPTADLKDVDVRGPSGTSARNKGGRGTGGSGALSWTTLVRQALASAHGELWLWAIGAMCMVGGIVYAGVERLLGGRIDWQLVIGAEIAGLLFIATAITAESQPWILVLAFLGIVGVIIWYVWEWKKKQPAPAAARSQTTTSDVTGPGSQATTYDVTGLASEAEAEAAKLAALLGIHAAPATPTAGSPPAPAK